MKFSISNFKSINKLDVDIKNLTILTGLNSSGKSSFIDATRMLYRANLGKSPFLNNQGNFSNLLYEWFSDEEVIKFDFSHKETSCSLLLSKDGQYAVSGHLPFRMFYVGADRIGAQLYSQSISEQIEENDFTISNNSLKYLNDHHSDVIPSSVLPDTQSDKALLYALEDWMQLISPTSRLNVQSFSEIDVLSLRINNRRASNVGFGISYVFPIILSLLAAANKKDVLLVLENPEAHIHPKGQSILGELIAKVANTGTRIILETHSDHILSGIRIAAKEKKIIPTNVSILFFQLLEENGQIYTTSYKDIKLDENGRFNEWPQDFFDQFDVNLERLLK